MSVFDKVGDFVDDNKSQILFGIGLIFTGATTVLAVKSTPKAVEDIRAKERELKRPLTKWEKVKTCWRHYIWPAVTEAIGITCLVAGKRIDLGNVEAALSAASVSKQFLDEYSKNVANEIGEEKNEEIKKETIVNRAKRMAGGSEDCSLMEGDSWFRDPFFNKDFIANKNIMDAAVNYVNDRINDGEDVPFNDFFDVIRMSKKVPVNENLFCDAGEFLGFPCSSGPLEITYDKEEITVNGVKTLAYIPIYGYKKKEGIRYPEFIVGLISSDM